MDNSSRLTVATANLFNFVEPPNAFYDFENIYSHIQWEEKCRWTKEKIESFNADIVAVQEVFSIEAATSLFHDMGYPHVAFIDQPALEDDYIYSSPVVGLASKYPISHVQAVKPPAELADAYNVTFPEFSRKVIHATVNIPKIGEISVYVAHLKSQRPTDSQNAGATNKKLGQWLSSVQRGWEAVLLRLYMDEQYKTAPMPTILMGDMNQTLQSNITVSLLNNQEEPYTLKLEDSWHLASSEDTERKATHYHFAKGNVLDYILLSQEFNSNSSHSIIQSIEYRIIDEHLINPIFEHDSQASDHAFVATHITFSV
ncbi:endonuclease/exonuclease/phosphatase family protein [Vibrio sp.]|nr:endonuclease/exonuclease/phosphatase family protein [Vibrio sp.]